MNCTLIESDELFKGILNSGAERYQMESDDMFVYLIDLVTGEIVFTWRLH